MPATLNYFDLPGRAEAIRVALSVGGLEFEDKRLSFAEFGASSFKHLPVLQMEDGTEYTQSTALLRYAGKIAGLYPEDPLEALRVDEIVMIAEDLNIAMFGTMAEQDPKKQLKLRQELSAGKLTDLLKSLAARLASNKPSSSPYFVGDSLTIAELQVHAVILTVESGFLQGIPTTLVSDTVPTLKELHAAVLKHPKVEAYYAPPLPQAEIPDNDDKGDKKISQKRASCARSNCRARRRGQQSGKGNRKSERRSVSARFGGVVHALFSFGGRDSSKSTDIPEKVKQES